MLNRLLYITGQFIYLPISPVSELNTICFSCTCFKFIVEFYSMKAAGTIVTTDFTIGKENSIPLAA